MKFIADMGISPKTVDFLNDRGHDAVHLHRLGLHRLEDSDILKKARREKSIVLTHDLDFGDLLAASGDTLPSVIIFRLRNMRPDNVNAYIRVVLSQFSKALKEGAVIVVTEGRIRIRSLPLGV